MAGGLLFLVIYSFLSLVNLGLANNVIVNTKSGDVAGNIVKSIIENEKYYSFLGIPYAEPPVGDLRFKAPKPHQGWDDVFKATKRRNHCPHENVQSLSVPNNEFGFCGNEDCLHLNIYSPKISGSEKLSVIVFVQNEQFRISFNTSKDYSPDFFMRENVIVVTISHRLGALGFLSFEDDLVPGNNGLRDVILALEWIKENIENFGGDPGKVTLMGSLSGATLVNLLLHSPKAKGLFHNAILQSGTIWDNVYFNKDPRQKALALTKDLDFDETKTSHLLERLLSVTPDKISQSEMRSMDSVEARLEQKGLTQFGPVIEHDHPDAVLTKHPKDNLRLDVPIMIGHNSREGIKFSSRLLIKPQYLTFADRDFLVLLPRNVDFKFDISSYIYYEAIKEIKDHYFEEGYIKTQKPGEYVSYVHDILRFYPTDYAVAKYTNNTQNTVYYYMFDYSGDLNYYKNYIMEHALDVEGSWGASEKDELCYLFVCNQIRKTYKKALEDETEEITVLGNMVRMWSNFAKFSNPTPGESEFIWTPASHEKKECLVISDELEMKSNLKEDTVQFWDNFIAKYQELAVDGLVTDVKSENDEL